MSAEQRPFRGAHRHDQLVVGLPHLGLVLRRLSELRTEPEVIRESAELGLGLVKVRLDDQRYGAGRKPGYSPIDLLLEELREYFRARNGRWAPPMGKNRLVENVGGQHVISGGGEPLGPNGDVQGAHVISGGGHVISGGGKDTLGPSTAIIGGRHDTGVLDLSSGRLPDRPASPGEGVRVGVADTELFPHPWLAGAYLARGDALLPEQSSQPQPPTAGHATFVAGMILMQAPGAAIVLGEVLDSNARGDSWDVAEQLVHFARSGVQIINVSLGCFTDDGEPPLVFDAALRRLGSQVVLVAAAGNHGDGPQPTRPLWPAAYDDVVAVGATDAEGKRAFFSPDAEWVDLLAPGHNVVSTYFDGGVPVQVGEGEPKRFGGLAIWSGTSFAAGWVSGLLAAKISEGCRDPQVALAELTALAASGESSTRLPSYREGRP